MLRLVFWLNERIKASPAGSDILKKKGGTSMIRVEYLRRSKPEIPPYSLKRSFGVWGSLEEGTTTKTDVEFLIGKAVAPTLKKSKRKRARVTEVRRRFNQSSKKAGLGVNKRGWE